MASQSSQSGDELLLRLEEAYELSSHIYANPPPLDPDGGCRRRVATYLNVAATFKQIAREARVREANSAVAYEAEAKVASFLKRIGEFYIETLQFKKAYRWLLRALKLYDKLIEGLSSIHRDDELEGILTFCYQQRCKVSEKLDPLRDDDTGQYRKPDLNYVLPVALYYAATLYYMALEWTSRIYGKLLQQYRVAITTPPDQARGINLFESRWGDVIGDIYDLLDRVIIVTWWMLREDEIQYKGKEPPSEYYQRIVGRLRTLHDAAVYYQETLRVFSEGEEDNET